ncbi:MAG: RcnB family protein [Candidatus Accumulibacter sp.]|nr:RcnB family protein [Accumulibacter sp.]
MKHRLASPLNLTAALLIAGALVSASALATPKDFTDHGGDHRSPQAAQRPPQVAPQPPRPAQYAPHPQAQSPRPVPAARHRPPPPPPPRAHFDDRHRGIAHDYYARAYSGNHCPPGMSHRGPTCVPDHARSWRRGHTLPAGVTYYDLPARLLVQLPVAPVGHRYVRVGGDILMLAIGTGIVVDALQDLFY